MKVAILLGLTALVAIQAAAVPSPDPEAVAGGITQILGKPVPKIHHKHHHHKHHHHKHQKHDHHKHHHHHKLPHKGHLGKKKPNTIEKAAPYPPGFCGVRGMPCLSGKRDVDPPQGYEEGYCGAPGNPCNTVRRAAWAVADALEAARDVTDSPSFDGAPNTPGALAEEAIGAVAAKARDVYGAVYAREAEAYAKKAHPLGIGFCGPPGSPCLGGRDAAPEPAKKAHPFGIGFCGPPGSPCLGGRDAEPDAEAEAFENEELGVCGAEDTPCLADRNADPEKKAHPFGIGFCGPPGSPCLGGRDAKKAHPFGIGFCGPPGSPCLGGRDAAAEKKAHPFGIGFCGPPGSPCLGGKRDAAPEAEKKADPKGIGFCGPPGSPCLGGKRDAAPEPEKKAHPFGIDFCGPPGSPCLGGKRDAGPEPSKQDDGFCGLPGTPCVGDHDAESIAKKINETDPTWLKQECHKPGHACNTLFNIHDAFHRAKGEANEAGKIQDPMAKWEAHCSGEGAEKCGFLTWAHQYAAKHNKPAAEKVEQYCDSRGMCTEAKRDLEELESTIDAAVAAVQAAA